MDEAQAASNEGLGPDTATHFGVFWRVSAPPAGLEPAVDGIEARCLIQFGHGGEAIRVAAHAVFVLLIGRLGLNCRRKLADVFNVNRKPHAVTIPRRLQTFLSAHPDAEVAVFRWASFDRAPDADLPPSLSGLPSIPTGFALGLGDFANVIRMSRAARAQGSAYQIVETPAERFHLSALPTIDRTHVVFVKHPEEGFGEEHDDQTDEAQVFRGSCDRMMHLKSLDPPLQRLLGIDLTASEPVRLSALVDDDSFDDLVDCWIDSSITGVSSCSVQFRDRDDERDDWFHFTFFDSEETIEFSIVSTADNLRARRAQEARVRLSNISETIPHGIFRISESGHIIYKNSKVEEILGETDYIDFDLLRTVDGEPLSNVVPRMLTEAEEAQFEFQTDVNGATRFLRVRVRLVSSAAGGREFVGSLEDVTDDVERSTQLEIDALTDPMTGAANRRALEMTLSDLLEDPDSSDFAVMLLDLDGFKQVNDSLGHGAGDQVIAEFGRRLMDACRSQDLVARLGGDEFVMIVQSVDGYDDAMAFAERLLPLMRAPFLIDDTTIELSGSIGVAIAEFGYTVRNLLQMADHAMYEAKRAGRNQASPYHTPDSANPVSPLAMRRDLRRAIGDNGLDLAFQPIFAIDDLIEPEAAEALLRWDHPSLGAVDPSTMISIAEQSGLMGELGEWIVNEAVFAAAQINNERGEHERPISINVNVSALQVGRPDFVDSVAMALDVNELAPNLLTVELTESYLIDHLSDGRKALDEITDMGVRLAIDDFGTGFSTFEYLITMPVYSVKIDPSFTKRLADPRGRAMLSGLGQACRELDMLVIVEGVETPEQLLAAREAGATHAQGYLLGKPVRSKKTEQERADEASEAA